MSQAIVTADEHGMDALVMWARGRIDQIARTAAVTVWRDVPGYRRCADLRIRSEVEQHNREVVEAFVSCVEQRRHPRRSDFPWTGRHAMRRVEAGIDLPDFLKAFRVSQLVLWEDLMTGVAEGVVTREAASAVVSQLMHTIEEVSSAAGAAYLEAQQYRLADSDRIARDLLEHLLAGTPPTVVERQAQLEQLGLPDGAPLLVVVAELCDSAPQRSGVLRRVRSVLGGPSAGLVVARRQEVVALLPVGARGEAPVLAEVRATAESLAAAGFETGIGLSTVAASYAAVPGAYEEARLALQALTGRPGARAMSELSTIDLLVHSQDGLERLVPNRVRDFLAEDGASGGTLVETLSAFVAHDLNARATADELHVHVNTVYYRLDRIAERTGRDVRSAEQLIDLLVGLRLLRAGSR